MPLAPNSVMYSQVPTLYVQAPMVTSGVNGEIFSPPPPPLQHPAPPPPPHPAYGNVAGATAVAFSNPALFGTPFLGCSSFPPPANCLPIPFIASSPSSEIPPLSASVAAPASSVGVDEASSYGFPVADSLVTPPPPRSDAQSDVQAVGSAEQQYPLMSSACSNSTAETDKVPPLMGFDYGTEVGHSMPC